MQKCGIKGSRADLAIMGGKSGILSAPDALAFDVSGRLRGFSLHGWPLWVAPPDRAPFRRGFLMACSILADWVGIVLLPGHFGGLAGAFL